MGAPKPLTRWPWLTAVVAVVAVFNPLGMDIIDSSIRYSPTDWLRDLWVMITIIGIVILAIMGFVEYMIRSKVARHRLERAQAEAGANPRA